MAENNYRWWENYLVRYLAGNIFAVLMLFYLGGFHGGEIGKSLCANIPIENKLVLCSKKESYKQFSTEIFNFIFQTTKEIKFKEKETKDLCIHNEGFILDNDAKITITETNFVNILILGVFGFLYMYISSIPIYFLHITRGFFSDSIHDFLKKSTRLRHDIKDEKTSRYKNKGYSPEYITSYQHLREHGNAFGIIFMEIIFAFLLVKFNFSVVFFLCWLLIGFSGWFIGINLEFKLLNINFTNFICLLLFFISLFFIFYFALIYEN